MTDVAGQINRLRVAAEQLDTLSKEQDHVLARLEPLERRYELGLAEFEREQWRAHIFDGKKFPSERVRDAIYKGQVPEGFLTEIAALHSQRQRKDRQISNLRVQVDAHRSILSALKLELEATV
jgi:hypothetical protein